MDAVEKRMQTFNAGANWKDGGHRETTSLHAFDHSDFYHITYSLVDCNLDILLFDSLTFDACFIL